MTHSLDRLAYTLPNDLCDEIRSLIAQHKIMKDALEFYANPTHWVDRDPYVSTPCIFKPNDSDGWGPNGDRAREALKSIEGKHNGS